MKIDASVKMATFDLRPMTPATNVIRIESRDLVLGISIAILDH